MGSVASLTSAMAVAAPVIGATLLGAVSHLDPSHWLVGLPFFACCVLQVCGAVIAIRHFSRAPKASSHSATAASS